MIFPIGAEKRGWQGASIFAHRTIRIRNTNEMTLRNLLKSVEKYLEQNVVLGPLESTRYIVPSKDKAGGSGANFVVVWKSEKSVNLPIIESVMIGAEGQQGISFTSRGQSITNKN